MPKTIKHIRLVMQKQIRFFAIFLFVFYLPLNCFSSECKEEQAKRFFKMAQEQTGKNKKAREGLLNRALEAVEKCDSFDNTQKIKILLSIGQIRFENGKKKEGVSILEKAVDLERMAEFPNSFTFVTAGNAFAGLNTQKQLEKAVNAYEEALEINSFSSETLKEEAKNKLKKTREAMSNF